MAASSRPSKTYDEMTVVELRSLLRARGLPTTGRKADLIARLLPFHSSHRHASPTRAASPVRVSSSPPARLSGGMPSGLGSSSGATLEARRISLHHYIMADFFNDDALYDLDPYLGPIVAAGIKKAGFFSGYDMAVEDLSGWQMDAVRSLSLDQLAAAEHLMEALSSNQVFGPDPEDYETFGLRRILGFLIVDGQFLIRQVSPQY